jgi:Spy/CpxP family protein refolding chaperone
MKNVKMYAWLMAMSMLVLVSCQDDMENDNMNVDSSEYIVSSFDDLGEVEIGGGTMEQEFMIEDMYANEENGEGHFSGDKPMMKRGMKGRRHGGGNGVGRVFRDMELTEDQRGSIRDFMMDMKDCAKENMVALRELNSPAREELRAARKAIIDRVKAGEITREEAHAEMNVLRAEMRESMQNDPEREALIEALKECRKAFIDSISGILTPEQLEIWNAWLAELEARRNG